MYLKSYSNWFINIYWPLIPQSSCKLVDSTCTIRQEGSTSIIYKIELNSQKVFFLFIKILKSASHADILNHLMYIGENQFTLHTSRIRRKFSSIISFIRIEVKARMSKSLNNCSMRDTLQIILIPCFEFVHPTHKNQSNHKLVN